MTTISLGALSAPLGEQIPSLAEKDAEILERDALAISRLHIRGLITDSQAHAARKKLVKLIEKAAKHD